MVTGNGNGNGNETGGKADVSGMLHMKPETLEPTEVASSWIGSLSRIGSLSVRCASGRMWCVTSVTYDPVAGWANIALGAVAMGKLVKANTREKHRLHLGWNGERWAWSLAKNSSGAAWCQEHEPDLLPQLEAELRSGS